MVKSLKVNLSHVRPSILIVTLMVVSGNRTTRAKRVFLDTFAVGAKKTEMLKRTTNFSTANINLNSN